MESEKFPKATFKGVFDQNVDLSKGTEGTYNVNARGELMIHGVTKQIAVPVEIIVEKNAISASLIFNVEVEEFGVKIPKLMFKKIAEVVEVTAAFQYKPYN